MSTNSHYFLAIRLPDFIKNELNQFRERNQEKLTFQRWVHKEDYHITLAFLGIATQNQLKDVQTFVSKQLKDETVFSLTVSQIGTFGMKTSPRIFWAGLDDSKPLQILHEKVFNACEQAGFQLETRPFHPHITLARKWAGEDPFDPALLTDFNIFREQPLNFIAKDFVLYKTNLFQTPKYENLITFSLHS